MSKKHFIALANDIIEHNRIAAKVKGHPFTDEHLETLADFCKGQNYNFNRSRWVGYIRGENGPSGGAVKS